MNFKKIKNIVFDLGNVIINIDFDRTYHRFAQLSGRSYDEILHVFREEAFFRKYETGQLSEKEFFKEIKRAVCPSASEYDIKDAWNALLLDIPLKRIELVQALSNKYKLYVLSNTNETHIHMVNQILYQSAGIRDLKALFDKVYYSYEIQMVKPDKEIYDFVCADCAINPDETIFLDDLEANLVEPNLAGWKTLHVKHPLTIMELLENA